MNNPKIPEQSGRFISALARWYARRYPHTLLGKAIIAALKGE